jgi:hypothetical protein
MSKNLARNPLLFGIALIAIGIIPMFGAEVLRKQGYHTVGFGLAWGLNVMPLAVIAGGIACLIGVNKTRRQ